MTHEIALASLIVKMIVILTIFLVHFNSFNSLSNLVNECAAENIIENFPDDGTPHFEFRDVVFAYPSRPKNRVFDGFNLKIKAGETVALVGPRYVRLLPWSCFRNLIYVIIDPSVQWRR